MKWNYTVEKRKNHWKGIIKCHHVNVCSKPICFVAGNGFGFITEPLIHNSSIFQNNSGHLAEDSWTNRSVSRLLPGRRRLERGKPFIEFLIAGLSTNRRRVFGSRDLSRPIRARDSQRHQSQLSFPEMLAAEKLSCGPEVLYHQRI